MLSSEKSGFKYSRDNFFRIIGSNKWASLKYSSGTYWLSVLLYVIALYLSLKFCVICKVFKESYPSFLLASDCNSVKEKGNGVDS